MIFGAEKNPEKDVNEVQRNVSKSSVDGMKTFDRLLFTLFRITLVDDYDFDVRSISSMDLYLILFRFLFFSGYDKNR